jgi:hypothetical protein
VLADSTGERRVIFGVEVACTWDFHDPELVFSLRAPAR